MKRVMKATLLAIAFLGFTFNIKVAFAQTGVDGTTDNGTTNGTTNETTNNGIPNTNTNDDTLDDNDNDDADVVDTDNNGNGIVENATYGLGGALLGGIVTYVAVRDRKTGTV